MTATQLDDEQLAAFGTYANHYRTLSDYDAIAAPLMFPFNQHFDLMWNVGSAQKNYWIIGKGWLSCTMSCCPESAG